MVEGRHSVALTRLSPSPATAGEADRTTHPLARSGKWLSSACGRRTARGPSFTVSRSTSRATSRSPDGSSTRLSCAAPRLFGPVRRQREGVEAELRDRAPPPCRRAAAADASARGWGSPSRPTPRRRCRRPESRCSDSRRAPRCRSCNCRTSSGISRSSAWLAASGCVAGSSSLSAARGGGSAGAAVSGSGLRPSASGRAHRRHRPPRGTAAPARAAACRASAPMVLRPSRSSVRTVSASRRSAETWRRLSAPLPSREREAWREGCSVRCTPSPRLQLRELALSPLGRGLKRASAQAAAAVGAIATRAVSPSAREPPLAHRAPARLRRRTDAPRR